MVIFGNRKARLEAKHRRAYRSGKEKLEKARAPKLFWDSPSMMRLDRKRLGYSLAAAHGRPQVAERIKMNYSWRLLQAGVDSKFVEGITSAFVRAGSLKSDAKTRNELAREVRAIQEKAKKEGWSRSKTNREINELVYSLARKAINETSKMHSQP